MNDMAHMLTLTVSAALATGALTFPVTMPGGLHEARTAAVVAAGPGETPPPVAPPPRFASAEAASGLVFVASAPPPRPASGPPPPGPVCALALRADPGG